MCTTSGLWASIRSVHTSHNHHCISFYSAGIQTLWSSFYTITLAHLHVWITCSSTLHGMERAALLKGSMLQKLLKHCSCPQGLSSTCCVIIVAVKELGLPDSKLL